MVEMTLYSLGVYQHLEWELQEPCRQAPSTVPAMWGLTGSGEKLLAVLATRMECEAWRQDGSAEASGLRSCGPGCSEGK